VLHDGSIMISPTSMTKRDAQQVIEQRLQGAAFL